MSSKANRSPRYQSVLTDAEEKHIREGFRRLEKNSRFFDSHSSEWKKQHPDMYLAVYQEALVCVAATAEDLITCLRDKGVPVEESYCQFPASQPITLAPANRTALIE